MSEKIKVLHVVVDMGHGGYENYLMNVFRKLDRDKFEFNFLVFKGHECYFEKEIESLGGKVFHCTFSDDFRYFKARKQLKKIVNENHFDILHCHTHYYSFLFLKYYSKRISNVILHSHNSRSDKSLKGRIVSLLSKYPSRKKYSNLACSDIAGKYFFGRKGRYEICPNCIDSETFAYNEKRRDSLRERYGIDKNTLVLGHIGRFTAIKNHKFLLDIAKQLSDKGIEYKLCLCGVGALKDKIANRVENKVELKNHVIFLEPGDVKGYYSLFDILLLPSLAEGFPLTLLESQAAGCYSLASDTITKEVVLTDKIEYLPISSPQSWVDRIIEISNNSLNYNRLTCNEAVKESRYDSLNATKFLENYYLRICKK